MPNSGLSQRDPPARWQLPLLSALVVAIVLVPFLVLRQANLRAEDAKRWTMHTLEVEARTLELAAEVRRREVATLARAAGVDAPLLRERIESAGKRIPLILGDMRRLTRDNPDQQLRLGRLDTVLAARLAETDVVVDAGPAATLAQVESMTMRHLIQPLLDEFIVEERKLLVQRQAALDAATARTRALTWAAMGGQLLLLGLLALFARAALVQRLAAERTSQRANQRASAVLEAVREPIVLVDRELRVVMHNAAFAELYGGGNIAQGTALDEVGSGAWKAEAALRRLTDVIARGRELWDFEQLQVTADGVERTMLINARRMPLPDSAEDVVLVTASDISVQKASERQIRDLARQLEGKVAQVSDVNRELEAFSYSVSHDLRAPLRHIAGFADKLRRSIGDGGDDRTLHYLEVIRTSAKRMSALIDDLLVYSRLGRSALRLQPIDMQSMVDEVRALLDSNAATEYPGHRIEWDVGPMPIVVGDDNMLRQVWQNLLANAVKYSSRSEPARITVRHRRDDAGDHHFSIADNGTGFDMAYAGKLFGVFQRLHAASEYSGTGIGLASVKRVLTRHRGRVWAESDPGHGATFHFVLPATPEPTDTTSQAPMP